MLELKLLHAHLEELLRPSLFSDYCPNGLQIQGKPHVKKIATAVSASMSTIEAALDADVQALIVHHGLFWSGDTPIIAGSKREKLRLILHKDLSIFAYHLPLDAHQEVGNNWKAARDMGWTDLEPFGLYKSSYIGVRGRISATREGLQKQLEKYYDHAAACAFGGKEKVETVALISGGAYKSIVDAAAIGIDCFITGNFDEPAWHQAFEEKINFYALGHSATEKVGPKALAEHLQHVFNIPCAFIDIPNPF